MKKIRFGIIGLGNQGSAYILTFFDENRIDNGYITAMCDNNPAKIADMKKRTVNKKAVYFTDYKEMIKSGLCDAVIVTVPHYLHPQIVIDCLAAGMPVLSDKPAGVYAKQVREMNEFAKKTTVPFGMIFNQRTNCLYKKMREIIAEGGIGELQRVTWIITDWFRTQHYYDSGSWRATWKGEGGGVLINQCPHQLDLLQWVVGKMPATVRGFCQYGRWHDIEVEDEVTVYMTYDNGATGVFITSTGETPGTNRFEVSGSLGKLLCENGKLYYYKNQIDSRELCSAYEKSYWTVPCEKTEVETDGLNPQHCGIINNFANALLGKEKLFVDGTEGINGVQLMNAIEYSGWHNGEEVSLPVDEDAYFAELEKHCEKSVTKHTDSLAEDNTCSYGVTVK